ncbi:MAG TPA: hypothetical protein VF546_17895 [Pyrinomonadaceae bacterium]|jgi:hypothetical protein
MADKEFDDRFGDEELDDKFYEMSVALARHEVDVSRKRLREMCFRIAKECARQNAEVAREMDVLVRQQYGEEAQKMAEWEEIMRQYEFTDDVIGEEESSDD